MTGSINVPLHLIAEALAEVYSGAELVEARALLDHLADRGCVVCFEIDDSRDIMERLRAGEYAGVDEDCM